MKNKRTLSLLLVVSLMASLCVGIVSFAATKFTDVPNSYWAHDEIEFIVNKGLFNGTTATTFSPDAQMKRGQLAAVLYRYAGSPKVSGTSGYSDVTSTAYYADACTWAKENKIFMQSKLNATALNPDEGITRSEFAVMLYNFAKLNNKADVKSNASNPYTDMKDVSSEIKTAIINWAVPAGILGGTTDTTMNPFGAIKRSHVAAMLYRYETKIANPGSGEEEKPTETKPTTPSDSTKTSYGAGDTLVLKKGGSYTVNIGIGDKVYIDDQLSSVEGWTAYDGNKFVDGKRVAEISWDSSKNQMALEGLTASTVTIQCLSMNDYTTVLATINVTVTSGSSSSGGNGNTSSGTSDDYMDIREEIVRLTNEVRKENGVSELPTDDALMRAAQAAAEEYAKTGPYWTEHDMKMESEKRRAEGITYSGGSNLTGVYETGTQAAEKAVDKWVNSPDHFKTMTKAKLDNIGVGVAEMSDGALVCFQFFGNKSSALGTYS
mgnify:FL=1